MTTDIEPGDIENELRELFRDKAGDAPLGVPGTPAAAPAHVLRHARRRQLGTVLGSAAVVVVLVAGSVAGLQRLLANGPEPLPTAGYDVFERTATVEAFTVTSPSDWYLVNEWPLSMQIAVEGSGGASSACVAVPGNELVECEDTPGVETQSPIPVPQGLPMIQLTNVDLGLDANACEDGIPNTGAALYVAFDAEQAIAGIADPTIPPFPGGQGLPPEGDGPCGPGRYANFTVNGEPFFAWIGLGSSVAAADRETVETAYERMSATPDWTPQPPNHLTPGYVIAAGATDAGDPWRLELRPEGNNLDLTLVGGPEEPSTEPFEVPSVPIEFVLVDPIFGAVTKEATRVEFRPSAGGPAIAATVVPLPPTLPFDFDLFYIEGTEGLNGDVVVLGTDEPQPSEPPPASEPRDDMVELSGTFLEQPWEVRATGSFALGTACIRVTISHAYERLCHAREENPLVSEQPSSDSWETDQMYLQVSSVLPDVVELRFVSDDDAIVPSEFRCAIGPLGWTDPDRKVCVILLPPEFSGTLEFRDAGGAVLFEQGIGAAVADPDPQVATPVDPVHGGTYWAVYPWIGSPGDPEVDQVSARLAENFVIEAFPGELGCDQGAAEALGRSDAEHAIGVYFETREDAEAFANELVDRNVATEAPIARVTTYCLD